MRTYKDFAKTFIGGSDVATLIMVGCSENGLITEALNFGEDGDYSAYIVTEDVEIESHYAKAATFNHWLKIYDDDGLAYRVDAKEINVYRAGKFGCIIQTINMKIKEFEGKIVTNEEFEKIENSIDVISLENNGNSGLHPSNVWWTAYLKDGNEFDFYTISE